jgi:hypothetical protein
LQINLATHSQEENMSPLAMLSEPISAATPPQAADYVQPRASLLAGILEMRLAAERGDVLPDDLPLGVNRDLRPQLPRIGMAALNVYLNRSVVESYPLIYTCMALAHPN